MVHITLVFNLLLIALASHASDVHSSRYFPEMMFRETYDNDKRIVAWYTKHLVTLGEPSLYEMSAHKDQQSYRFLWLRTYHEPVAIRLTVADQGSAILTVKMTNGRGGYETGELIINKTVPLSKDQVDQFISQLSKARFWELPTKEPELVDKDGMITVVADGAQWIYEAARFGSYHIVERTSPTKGAYQDVGIFLLKLSQLKVENIY